MIVVVGLPRVASGAGVLGPAGTVAEAALAAARRGAAVQLVGKVADDDAGDALLAAFARAGVGHAAVLRDVSRMTPVVWTTSREPEDPAADPDGTERTGPATLSGAGAGAGGRVGAGAGPSADGEPGLDAADVDLGLRYLPDFRVLVVAEPLPTPIVAVVVDAVRYAGATLVLVTAPREAPPADLPTDALVLQGPEDDAEGAFGRVLGEVAAAIDGGTSPADALEAGLAAVGASPSS